jgi:hypothetical protein
MVAQDPTKLKIIKNINSNNQRFVKNPGPRSVPYIGKDGRTHDTFEALVDANREHFRTKHRYIVHDAEKGRMEIAPGTGLVQICVGHKIVHNEKGRQYVPVYRTEVF